MRRILFRAKRIKDNAWIHGYLYRSYAFGSELGGTWILSNTGGSEPIKHEVYEDTVGQYTGITDSRGNLVFEGDIVEAVFNPIRATENPEVILGVVEYWEERAEFCVNCLKLTGSDLREIRKRSEYKYADGKFTMTFAQKGIVVGNIHDNAK